MFKTHIIQQALFHVFDHSDETAVNTLLKCSQAPIEANVTILLIVSLLLPLLTFGGGKKITTQQRKQSNSFLSKDEHSLLFSPASSAALCMIVISIHSEHLYSTAPTIKLNLLSGLNMQHWSFGKVSPT